MSADLGLGVRNINKNDFFNLKIPFEKIEKIKFILRYGILTSSGDYIFFEVNPSGQWLWIEHLTGLPISRAIAELLANPSKP